MLKTPQPAKKHHETDTDKYFSYLVNHVTRTTDNQPIATISPDQSAQRTWTTLQVTLLAVLASLTLVALWCFGISILTILFALVTCLYVALLAMATSWLVAISKAQPETPFNDEMINDLSKAPWPMYTILCPLYHEKAVVPQFVNAMKALDYPQDCLQVLFLTEEDDTETRSALRAMTLPSGYEVLTVPAGTPRTKPRACNYGLQHANGEYIVIYDAEDIPDPLQLKKAVLTFASSPVDVACVQARLNFYNINFNLITRWFCAEYSLWFDLILPGLQRLGFSLPLGGTSNHFRISALKALGGWDSYNVTEDADLGLKLVKYGFKTIMLDSTTYEEANSRVFSWIRQRSRWIKGYMQTYLVHTRHPLKTVRQGKVKDLLSLHLFVGAGSIVLLINPLMWAMFAAYLIWRPVDLYHALFPWPVLYAGMLCFLVGNFLPIYVSMIACIRREQYGLVKYCLLLPLYWILASVAAFLAGYELIVKPHHWHKTEHGLHLKDRKSTEKIAAISMKVAAISGGSTKGNVTQSVRAMSTVLMPVARIKGHIKVKVRDPWLLLTLATACIASVTACFYYFYHQDILLYNDAYSHLRISRSVLDSITPGFAQLGTVWLPLPHLLMEMFVWNNTLWHTGLAGSFVSMPCYVVTATYLFLFARRMTGSSSIAYVGTLVFILNPNMLYLQSTPLDEPVCVVMITLTCYHLMLWIQEQKLSYLVLTACFTFLATLARYDGWALAISVSVVVLVNTAINYRKRSIVEGMSLLFVTVGSIGIVLWLVWNKLIAGDFLYFKRGPFSSQAGQAGFLRTHTLYAYHNLLEAFRDYFIDAMSILGPGIFFLAIGALLLFLMQKYRSMEALAMLAFITSFGFYVISLYSGQAIIYTPLAIPINAPAQVFNTRYGVEMLAPASVLIAILVSYAVKQFNQPIISTTMKCMIVVIIVTQAILTTQTGILALQDGQTGIACVPTPVVNVYLSQHYQGGYVMLDVSGADIALPETGIDFKNVIYDGSYRLWHEALHQPEKMVTWVILIAGDKVDQGINHAQLAQFFNLSVQQKSGLQLWHIKNAPIFPLHPLPGSLLINAHKSCTTGAS